MSYQITVVFKLMKKLNDHSLLVSKAQKGDKQAYREFFNILYPYIEAKVKNRIFNPSDIPDVVQEILISIHQSLNTYDASYPLSPWVNTICQRRIIDYIRKISRLEDSAQNEEFDVTNTIGAANINSEAEALEVLNLISPQYREVILLTKVIGHSTAEAAQILGIKENALRTRVSRGFKELEASLKKTL